MPKNKDIMEKYFELWKQNNILRLAIEKCGGTHVELFNSLVSQKKSSDKELESAQVELLKKFTAKTNILSFRAPWYFLCYKNKDTGENNVLVFPLRIGKKLAVDKIGAYAKQAGEFAKNVKKFRPEKTLRSYTDEVLLNNFFKELTSEAQKLCSVKKESKIAPTILNELFGSLGLEEKVVPDLEKSVSTIVVDDAKKGTALKESRLSITQHAYLRWIQRVVGAAEPPSREQILRDIKKDFSEAGFIYHKERDNTFFFLTV